MFISTKISTVSREKVFITGPLSKDKASRIVESGKYRTIIKFHKETSGKTTANTSIKLIKMKSDGDFTKKGLKIFLELIRNENTFPLLMINAKDKKTATFAAAVYFMEVENMSNAEALDRTMMLFSTEKFSRRLKKHIMSYRLSANLRTR
jgi:hypothetical protein